MYYKIPLDADLSQTSYRDSRQTENSTYIEYNEGYVDKDWVVVEESDLITAFGCNPFVVIEMPEVSEQDEINAEILLNQAEILAKLNEQDEVQAQILLNQIGA